jgi:putative FmdB family regulatory protein
MTHAARDATTFGQLMPVYEYICSQDDSHAKLSVTRSILEDDPGYICEECESEMVRFFTPFGIQFKGSGFYKTDNAR